VETSPPAKESRVNKIHHMNSLPVKLKKHASLIALVVALGAFQQGADAAKLATLFSDHMVLQREQPVPVWGWAPPETKVTVEFAGQKKTADADASGKWLVKLEPLAASNTGRKLVARSSDGSSESIISDVVVGDVWICSGQSNMHFTMRSVANAAEEIAGANNPSLRFFTVGHQFGRSPSADVNGEWQSASTASTGDCSAVAYYFGDALQKRLGVPIGLIVSSVGGTRIETWMHPETLAATGESSSLVEKWKGIQAEEFERIATTYRAFQDERDRLHPEAVKAAKALGNPLPPPPKMPKLRCHDCPSALHNGMIAPLQPYALRGAIWYQGEANSGQPAPYEKLLPAMISDWRKVWGEKMPFLFVQLAPYKSTHPGFREAQFRIWEKTPGTAMVVTTDVGDANNIHPTRKRPVGERLAAAALALSYGQNVVYSGPVFSNWEARENRAVISFKNLGGGLVAEGVALKGFALAGSDGKFVDADASIDGQTVVVSSDKIERPAAVRFGWSHVPDVNFFNREGFPAVPFRADAPAR
jgi:sialate O-acetylesterase